ncbi:ImmA/IrrE family metallo-endopeptidase [Subtercola sp. YIM 133946]|uniref:ImmA/IrrE family metallo-endopeptidase n=1 Tax=Subtercola sp. YIM 133946 TaxID=3118909 RepID=UPI002F9426D1
MTVTTAFEPKWASKPSDAIRKLLDHRGWMVEDLADRLGIGDPATRRLLAGTDQITADLAALLSDRLGGSASFWLTRERQYRESLEWLTADELAQRMPMSQMIQLGWIGSSDSWRSQARIGLNFFGASDAEEGANKIRAAVGGAHYRTSTAFSSDEVTLAAWLRQAEMQVNTLRVDEWDASRLRNNLAAMRDLTRVPDPADFLPALQKLGAESGVAIVLVRAPKGCVLSGAAFKTSNGAAAIGLTARHLSDDHLWFTVFHEIGHLLLHGVDETFLDDFETAEHSDEASSLEAEADDFARQSLVPAGIESLRITGRGPTKRDVLRFASRENVSAGAVVGQLQHEGVLQFSQLNALKRRYKWDGTTLRI